jgi:hypothetical protein
VRYATANSTFVPGAEPLSATSRNAKNNASCITGKLLPRGGSCLKGLFTSYQICLSVFPLSVTSNICTSPPPHPQSSFLPSPQSTLEVIETDQESILVCCQTITVKMMTVGKVSNSLKPSRLFDVAVFGFPILHFPLLDLIL